MRQRWWIAIVAVVGVGLAILLFPRPDTGEALPDGGGAVASADPAAASGKAPTARPKLPEVDPTRVRTGVKPGMEDLVAKRNRPEAVYASKLVTPFSSIRYTLVKEGSEPARALADEVGKVMADLRTMRLDPDAMAWADLEAKTNAMMAQVKASPFASNEQIVRSSQKYEDYLAEYRTAKEAEANGTPAPVEVTPPSEEN
jgi:hypothetical protein